METVLPSEIECRIRNFQGALREMGLDGVFILQNADLFYLSRESGATISFLDSPHGGRGNTPAMAQGASDRRIGRNEPIGIDYGIGVNGYVADQFRTLVIGDLPVDLMRTHDFSLEIHSLFVKEAKPGVSRHAPSFTLFPPSSTFSLCTNGFLTCCFYKR